MTVTFKHESMRPDTTLVYPAGQTLTAGKRNTLQSNFLPKFLQARQNRSLENLARWIAHKWAFTKHILSASHTDASATGENATDAAATSTTTTTTSTTISHNSTSHDKAGKNLPSYKVQSKKHHPTNLFPKKKPNNPCQSENLLPSSKHPTDS